MRRILKRLSSVFLVPAVRWYLRKERSSTYRGVTVKVYPGVFHPGLFHSTHFLLDFLLDQPLQNKTLLELGCGSGLISLMTSKAGATVTATDLNPKAIENCRANAITHSAAITLVTSDLFAHIPAQTFDWIVVNPPYYRRNPANEEELAWNAGADFDYFVKFFSSLPAFLNPATKVIMVITKGTDLPEILRMAAQNGFALKQLAEEKRLFDKRDYLYQIVRLH